MGRNNLLERQSRETLAAESGSETEVKEAVRPACVIRPCRMREPHPSEKLWETVQSTPRVIYQLSARHRFVAALGHELPSISALCWDELTASQSTEGHRFSVCSGEHQGYTGRAQIAATAWPPFLLSPLTEARDNSSKCKCDLALLCSMEKACG